MIKILINGCNGKMGQELAKAIERNDNFQTVCGFDRLDAGDNKFPVYTDLSKITEEPDVIIDFSIPIATLNILKFAASKKIPVVVATTGFTEDEFKKIKEYSNQIPIFHSSNMSFEVSLMTHLVEEIAKYLKWVSKTAFGDDELKKVVAGINSFSKAKYVSDFKKINKEIEKCATKFSVITHLKNLVAHFSQYYIIIGT